MTDQQPHTPSYEEVREATESDVIFLELGEFDRFLAERDARIEAAAERRGAIKALQDAAKDWRWSEWSNSPRNPIAAANYVGDWLTDRADQEGAQGE